MQPVCVRKAGPLPVKGAVASAAAWSRPVAMVEGIPEYAARS